MKYGPLIGLVFSMLLASCHTDNTTEVQTQGESFDLNNPLVTSLQRLTQYPTRVDNVLDGQSQCAIKLPVYIAVNQSSHVLVASAADYAVVQNIKNQHANDDDVVHFEFPITVILPNYEQRIMANETQWNQFRNGLSSSDAAEVTCAALVYPIRINQVNTLTNASASYTFSNNAALYAYLYHLTPTLLLNFEYPLQFSNAQGQVLTFTQLAAAQSAINQSITDCTPTITNTIAQLITTGTWKVSYFYKESDLSSSYTGAVLAFNNNGSFDINQSGDHHQGDWESSNNAGTQFISFHADIEPFDEFEGAWEAIEVQSNHMRFRQLNDDQTQYNYLTLTQQ